jgi:hypothetical protein
MDRMTERWRTRSVALLSAAAAGALLIGGCGGEDDFENDPRPPVPLQLTGVITDENVTVSPRTVAPGPIVLIVSNLTDRPHTISLEGPQVREETGPIPPADTASLQATLRDTQAGEGYEVRANSEGAKNPEEVIPPATIVIRGKPESVCKRLEEQAESEGKELNDPQCRGSSSDELLLP